ncbi:MAG: Re/Si-specific NAD(P)(+) transhydrogenase subunit alpha, partial [Phenylobacterium sp.]
MAVIAVIRESHPGETRVAATPETVRKLIASGFEVAVQAGAGTAAACLDADYAAAGARLCASAAEAVAGADILFGVRAPSAEALAAVKPGTLVAASLNPHQDRAGLEALAARGAEAYALEFIPRITRAQVMDVLSSQANLAGYRAVIEASAAYGRALPMMMTAAGTIAAAKVFVMGVGVAGLQAIATARRLGAIVEGYDVRAAVKDQVESLGAKFVDIDIKAEGAGGYARELTAEEKAQQQAILARHVAAADVLITTAAIPGRPSPKIISREMVEGMKGGSVIVDLAAEGGGNCELTQPGETILHHRVKIHGPINVPSTVSGHASELYAKNLLNLLGLLIKDGQVHIDLDDQILKD